MCDGANIYDCRIPIRDAVDQQVGNVGVLIAQLIAREVPASGKARHKGPTGDGANKGRHVNTVGLLHLCVVQEKSQRHAKLLCRDQIHSRIGPNHSDYT